MGSLYKQPGSRIWWVKYHVHGRPVRESTGTADEQEAKRCLKTREGQLAAGQPLVPRLDRIRYEEVLEDLRAHYEATGTRDLKEFRRRVKHLDRVFAGWHIAMIGQPDVDAYVVARRRKQAAGGTIRRELGTLTNAPARLPERQARAAADLHKPKEAAPRGAFFEWPQYEAVRRRLAPDLQVAVTVAYTSGGACRAKCSRSSVGTSISAPGRCGSIRAWPERRGASVYLAPECDFSESFPRG